MLSHHLSCRHDLKIAFDKRIALGEDPVSKVNCSSRGNKSSMNKVEAMGCDDENMTEPKTTLAEIHKSKIL